MANTCTQIHEFSTTCPGCQREFIFLVSEAGIEFECPSCKHKFTLQKPQPASPAAREEGQNDGLPEKPRPGCWLFLKWLGHVLLAVGILGVIAGPLMMLVQRIAHPQYNWWNEGLWIFVCGLGFIVDAAVIKLVYYAAREIAHLRALKEHELKNRG